MEAPERGAFKIVLMIAAALIVIGALDTGLYLAQCFKPQKPIPMNISSIVLNSIPAVLGIATLIKSKSLAQWIADKLDE